MCDQDKRGTPRGVVCDGCGKHVSRSPRPVGECQDCGGWFVGATPERLACDRCGAEDASRVLNSEHDRLCKDCIDHENRDNPECPDCDRRMLPFEKGVWECPDCWEKHEMEAAS